MVRAHATGKLAGFILAAISLQCDAQMIRSDALQQDTAKLNLCIDRARHGHSLSIGDQDLVPFEIDAKYVERARKDTPDVTFFATATALYECEVTGNGLYSPALSSGVNC